LELSQARPEISNMIGDDTGHCELALANGTAEVDGPVPVPMKAGSALLLHALTKPGNKDQHTILKAAA